MLSLKNYIHDLDLIAQSTKAFNLNLRFSTLAGENDLGSASNTLLLGLHPEPKETEAWLLDSGPWVILRASGIDNPWLGALQIG